MAAIRNSNSKAFSDLKLSFCLLFFVIGLASAQLSPTFYSTSCPNATSIIRTAVAAAIATETRLAASLLRLHFHDCFVQGCDASVLLDDTATFIGEKTALPNDKSLRGFEVIDNIKSQLENSCPGVVSCADILAVAARDSVNIRGGPSWTVPLGRRDSTTANRDAANSDLPGPNLNLSGLIASFDKKGFNANELVTLSGAHTIGEARCRFFKNRIYNESNVNPLFALALKRNCPTSGGDDNLANLDVTTPTKFDNAYFLNLVFLKGLFHSDQQLFNGGSTHSLVLTYSITPALFRSDFANAMIKMGNLSPLTGSAGQIRINCRTVNN
ncbi:Peroxidase [Quillaja saponaria]|uniref:Peroxidase n=1 Tax=Quillaja saponaria TaxID=32244 RepID=A0AAD7L290_QUISA|nr:Peroxidase [Quillaja saponaria]